MKSHPNNIIYNILSAWISISVFLILLVFMSFYKQEYCPDCPQMIWYLFFATLLLLALIAVTSVLIYQSEKHRFEEKKRQDENDVAEKRESFERIRMKEISEFRQAMEKYEKVQASIKELTMALKNTNPNTNTWPTKEQMEQIIGYMKQHEETFDHQMEKIKNNKSDDNG